MQLSFAVPAPALSHRVATYYLLSEDYSVMEDVQRADTGHLRIFLEGSGYYEFARGKRYASTRFFLNGPFTQHMRSVVQGPVRFIGVALFPESWGGLIGASAADYSDRAEDAAPLIGGAAVAWFDALQSLTTITEMAPIMDSYLTQMIKPVRADTAPQFKQSARGWQRRCSLTLPIFTHHCRLANARLCALPINILAPRQGHSRAPMARSKQPHILS